MSTTFNCTVETGALSGFYDQTFERVAEEFERNYRERDELGASVCVMVDGEPGSGLMGRDRTYRNRRTVEHRHLIGGVVVDERGGVVLYAPARGARPSRYRCAGV